MYYISQVSTYCWYILIILSNFWLFIFAPFISTFFESFSKTVECAIVKKINPWLWKPMKLVTIWIDCNKVFYKNNKIERCFCSDKYIKTLDFIYEKKDIIVRFVGALLESRISVIDIYETCARAAESLLDSFKMHRSIPYTFLIPSYSRTCANTRFPQTCTNI